MAKSNDNSQLVAAAKKLSDFFERLDQASKAKFAKYAGQDAVATARAWDSIMLTLKEKGIVADTTKKIQDTVLKLIDDIEPGSNQAMQDAVKRLKANAKAINNVYDGLDVFTDTQTVHTALIQDKLIHISLTDQYTKATNAQKALYATVAHTNAQSIINRSFLGTTWSDRIWANQKDLKADLTRILTRTVVNRVNPYDYTSQIEKAYGVNGREAYRILVTEGARVTSDVQRSNLVMNGFDTYEYVANSNACKRCLELDGKRFKVKDFEEGTNAPPIHPHCRCSIAGYADDGLVQDKTGKWHVQEDDEEPETSAKSGRQKESEQPKLTQPEKGALLKYIGPDSYVLNDSLRRGINLSPEQQSWVEDLDSALKKLPKYSGSQPLHRSMTFNSSDEAVEFAGKIDVGNVLDFPAYTSTSKSVYDADDSLRLIINKSYSGADLKGFNDAEQEVLFGRGSRFKVIRMYRDERGKPFVELEEV